MERLRMVGAATLAMVLAAGCGDDDASTETDGGQRADSGSQMLDGGGADAARSDGGGGGDEDSGLPVVACDAPIPALTMVEVTTERFSSPLYVTQPPGSDDLYVVERGGRVRIVRDGDVLETPFLNVSGLLNGAPTGGNEWGLLGLAFHPQYQTNGRFFIAYTPNGSPWRNIIAEGTRSDDPDVAEDEVTPIVTVADDAGNHNGGMLAFGRDGYLYAGIGDGGLQRDPNNRAQDLSVLLGKVLRLDVSVVGEARVPADNPFSDSEIWALGLRNPWRFSFDRETGDFWVGDVGNETWEEISVVTAETASGVNFGWPIYEGSRESPNRNGRNLVAGTTHHPPIAEYTHEDGVSIVGGYVYRGSAIPALRGVYFYGDSSADDYVRGLRVCDGEVTRGPEAVPGLERSTLPSYGLVSFGEDNDGELYMVYLVTGEVLRIVAAE
ncbi:PQQ-dependent sugar dehydrogenase [Sandaracinus amylolyticus]|uniref:PQQ-dependent sugar dehydrogenase n=1 Tax=Sandaracinus amylolyticus TaxID=927083 RepID=UPI001F203DA2|nr:PQQ-dependent sugar dehydrogenase [Sandaracinus amylolyticus]UJR80876.1 Soluble aldose sugar dehydrogenase YliI [Sandaracinus amylolyticus]